MHSTYDHTILNIFTWLASSNHHSSPLVLTESIYDICLKDFFFCEKMHLWMHEFFFLEWIYNVCMNVFLLIKYIYECMNFFFLEWIYNVCMNVFFIDKIHLWMHEYFFKCVHLWMHEFFFKCIFDVCLNEFFYEKMHFECMIFFGMRITCIFEWFFL